MAEQAQTLRQLKIKTGVVNRLFKEERTYRNEVTAQQAVLDKLKADKADGADIRNAERVLKDSEQMVPRTRKSLSDAIVALEDLVDALKADESISSSKEYQDASTALQQVEAAGKNGVQ